MMYRSAYDLKAFYNGKIGRIVRRVLQERIRNFWPDVKNMRIMGCGYAVPYLRVFREEAERVFALMPAGQGAHEWPQGDPEDKNLVCLAEESELPIESSSVDRVLLIHDLEYSEFLRNNLEEIWRVLKPNGRLLVIVPNRSGFWARADWSPFGQGTPYTAAQIYHYLHDNMFVHERTEEALFMPPIKYSLLFKSAAVFERIGRIIMPFLAGVHMVEASKQLYATPTKGTGSKVRVRGRGFIPRPVPQGFRIIDDIKLL
jgi:SAM-dependent methyltransferase